MNDEMAATAESFVATVKQNIENGFQIDADDIAACNKGIAACLDCDNPEYWTIIDDFLKTVVSVLTHENATSILYSLVLDDEGFKILSVHIYTRGDVAIMYMYMDLEKPIDAIRCLGIPSIDTSSMMFNTVVREFYYDAEYMLKVVMTMEDPKLLKRVLTNDKVKMLEHGVYTKGVYSKAVKIMESYQTA
jgi:hypothetical protein